MNLNNRDRFMVISDKFYTVEATHYTAGALDGGSPCPVFFNVFKKIQLKHHFWRHDSCCRFDLYGNDVRTRDLKSRKYLTTLI